MTPEQLLKDVARAYNDANPFMVLGDHHDALRAALDVAIEACAKAVREKAAELDGKECCGSYVPQGFDEPPECCCQPDYMISDREAEAAIRSLKMRRSDSFPPDDAR